MLRFRAVVAATFGLLLEQSGAQAPSTVVIPASQARPIPVAAGTGLAGEFWDRAANSNAVAASVMAQFPVDAILRGTQFDYPNGAVVDLTRDHNLEELLGVDAFPGSLVLANESFVMRFTGYFRVDQPAQVQFDLSSDDGSVLTVGGVLVIDNGGDHAFNSAPRTTIATFAVPGLYPMELLFYNNQFGSGLECRSTLTGSLGLIPVDHLYPPHDAAVQPFGVGCGLPPVALAASGAATPVLGRGFTSVVTALPAGASVYQSLGFSRTTAGGIALPIDLTSIGMDGCSLYHDASWLFLPCNVVGATATHTLAVPPIPAYSGLEVYLQAYAFAPGANAAGVITSNALVLLVGW